jgi:hypothetical protein
MKQSTTHASRPTSKSTVKARAMASFEKLEDRTLYSTYVVNVLGDPSVVPAHHLSLREAVTEANTAGGTSLVKFDPSVFNTPQTIDLQQALTVSNHSAKITITGPGAQLTLSNDSGMLVVGHGATVTVNSVNFLAPNGGEGVIVQNAGTLSLNNSDLTGAAGLNDMAGIVNTGTLKLTDVTIENHGDGNSGIAFGAGLQNSGSAQLLNVNFLNDDAGYGGAIAQTGGSLNAVNVTFSEDGADTNAFGGAIAIDGGTASFTNCTIDHSWIEDEGTPGDSYGVALFVDHSSVRLFDDTITNSAIYPVGYGGPGDVPMCGAVTIGGHGEVTMGNSVVSGMSEVAGVVLGTGPEVVGYLNSVGHNLIGQTSSTTFGLKSSDLRGTHASPLNPMLEPLANNGGYTQTELPEFGSPLIDAGSNSLIPAGITTDQRGDPRISNGTVDIGAVEFQVLHIHWPIIAGLFSDAALDVLGG